MCIMRQHRIDTKKNYYNVFSRLSSVHYCFAYYICDIHLLVEIKIIQAYYIIMSN